MASVTEAIGENCMHTIQAKTLETLNQLVGRCATCKHWRGDKEKARQMFEENPVSMDMKNGWPNAGICSEDYDFTDVETIGDAETTVEFTANFGCVYWCAIQTDAKAE